jgi:para-aminobenzoate synthetase component 1
VSRALHLEDIPYCPDSCELFEKLQGLPGRALLDSSFPHSGRGRFDILVAMPLADAPPPPDAAAGETASRQFFDRMRDYQAALFGSVQPAHPDLPFCGGVLGYISYDAGNGLHGVSHPAGWRSHSALQAYDWCLLQDHLLRRAVLVCLPSVTATARRDLLARLASPAPRGSDSFRLRRPFQASLEESGYRAAYEQIQRYIHAGDCYQVNLARRFEAPCEGDPWVAYRALRAAAAAPFAAYIEDDRGTLLCLSPERFLSLHGHHVETSPIKGTRPRYADAAADRLAADDLCNSPKDRAENLMIVDLLRNDLGRSCLPGSIHVDRLFELQSFPTVHHLVSTISGELRPDRGAWELLRDSFPGGSITGAPKRRAMEIIAELEPVAREAYCGSVLYVSADGRLDSNIAIRTLRCEGGSLRCWGGGGIVADSRLQREFQETCDKVGRFLSLLEERFMA